MQVDKSSSSRPCLALVLAHAHATVIEFEPAVGTHLMIVEAKKKTLIHTQCTLSYSFSFGLTDVITLKNLQQS